MFLLDLLFSAVVLGGEVPLPDLAEVTPAIPNFGVRHGYLQNYCINTQYIVCANFQTQSAMQSDTRFGGTCTKG